MTERHAYELKKEKHKSEKGQDEMRSNAKRWTKRKACHLAQLNQLGDCFIPHIFCFNT